MAKRLEIKLLGGIAFTVDGKPIETLPTRAGQAILVYLACQPLPVPRSELAHLFFQNTAPDQARANLRGTLSRIKKRIGDVLDANRAQVWMRDGVAVVVDALVFSEQLSVASKQLRKDAPSHESRITLQQAQDEAHHDLQNVLSLYNGDFLSGFHLRDAPEFEEWMIVERERLRLLAIRGIGQLVSELQQAGAYDAALTFVGKLLAIEPLLDQAHYDKMLLLMRTGQRSLALHHYATAMALFAEELGVPLAIETTALYERIQQMPATAPLLLPTSRRLFVGRTEQLAKLQLLLQQPSQRLVTLLGLGGVGKTRLSQEAARRLYVERPNQFLDGIYFVELAGVHSAENAAAQIAQTLEIRLSGKQPTAQQVTSYLQSKELLLILDNFEQLVEPAADFVATLLEQAPNVKLLITSRERLQLYEEIVFDLGGLQLPPVGEALTLRDEPLSSETAHSSEAVQLFLINVQQQQRNFAPTAAELDIIADVCRLLDGVPLGIELAAGWIRQYSLAGIAEQIATSLNFLATKLRNVPPRQRSLRAVFAHSWDLLATAQQATLANLSVFSGSFAAAAAQAIAGAAVDDLQVLLDKSLLQQVDDARFSVHPLLREFSAEKITDPQPLQLRHAQHYLDWLTAHGAVLDGDTTVLLGEAGNIRTAWQFAIRAEAAQLLTNAVPLLADLWQTQGWFSEGDALLRQSRTALVAAGSTPQQLDPYIGWMHFLLGQYDAAVALLEPLLSELPQPSKGSGLAKTVLGMCYLYTNKARESAETLTAAAADFRAMGALGRYANSLGSSSQAWGWIGERDKARAALDEALSLPAPARFRARLLIHDGQAQIGLGAYGTAINRFSESRTLMQQIGNRAGLASATVNLGVATLYAEQFEQSKQACQQALALFTTYNEPSGMAVALNTMGLIELDQANYAHATPFFKRSLKIYQNMNSVHGTVLAQAPLTLAQVGANAGDAQALLAETVELLGQIKESVVFAAVLPRMARAFALLDMPEPAIVLAAFTPEQAGMEPYYSRDAQQLLETLLPRAGSGEGATTYSALVTRGKASSADDMLQLMRQAVTKIN